MEALTNREQEVIELMAQGFSNKEIAKMLFISNTTLVCHVKSIYSKFRYSEANCDGETATMRTRVVLAWLKLNGRLIEK